MQPGHEQAKGLRVVGVEGLESAIEFAMYLKQSRCAASEGAELGLQFRIKVCRVRTLVEVCNLGRRNII